MRCRTVLRTGETFPTSPHDWEVVLSGQELLHLLVVAVSKICIVLISQVNAQALFGVTDRPIDQERVGSEPVERERYRPGVRLKPFVGEDVGVRKGGDDDVQRLAAIWWPVGRVLNSKDRQPDQPTSLGRGRTSRNLPPLTRGSNQPWYLAGALPAMIVWLSPVIGCAMTKRRVESRKDNLLSIF